MIDRVLTYLEKIKDNNNTYSFLIGYVVFSVLMYIVGGCTALTIIIISVCLKNTYNLITERVLPNYGDTWWVILGSIFSFLLDFMWTYFHDIPFWF